MTWKILGRPRQLTGTEGWCQSSFSHLSIHVVWNKMTILEISFHFVLSVITFWFEEVLHAVATQCIPLARCRVRNESGWSACFMKNSLESLSWFKVCLFVQDIYFEVSDLDRTTHNFEGWKTIIRATSAVLRKVLRQPCPIVQGFPKVFGKELFDLKILQYECF